MGDPQTAEILLDTPEVRVEDASKHIDDEEAERTVMLAGTMFADGLNANAWGLTEEGAQAIASSLKGADLTAGHPDVVGYGFTRSIHDGPGKPIGDVAATEVEFFEDAMMADVGGGYSASYEATITAATYADDFEKGLMVGGDYGVSIGITAQDEEAECSVCGDNFAACTHARGEDVDGQVAGPLYNSGEADHLAVVYVPAWKEADSDVAGAVQYASADEFFGQQFDDKHDHDHDHDYDHTQNTSTGNDQHQNADNQQYPDTETHSLESISSMTTEQSIASLPYEDGDLVEWHGLPELFGMVEHIDSERMVTMVGIHSDVDGELVPTGYTYTAGYGDVVPLGTQSQTQTQTESEDQSQQADAIADGRQEVEDQDNQYRVTVTPDPKFKLQL